MKPAIWILGVVVAVYLLHRLALWMEGRGWMYYKHKQAARSTLGNAFLEVQSLVDPGKRPVLEAKRVEQGEEDESGDPPEAGMRDHQAGMNDVNSRRVRDG